MLVHKGVLKSRTTIEDDSSSLNSSGFKKAESQELYTLNKEVLESNVKVQKANPTLNSHQLRSRVRHLHSTPIGMIDTDGTLISKVPVEGPTLTVPTKEVDKIEAYDDYKWMNNNSSD